MRLKHFRSRGIHGYLDFNLHFRSDLNFLTGINGSGKTSVLNAIVALITPDLSKLCGLSYESISVELDHEGRSIVISAAAESDRVELSASSVSATYSFQKYVPDPELPLARQLDRESEHYKEISFASSGHPVMRLIASLPTPMFLGLDRRARFDTDDRRLRAFATARHPRLGRNIFSASLGRSLGDAADLAETSYRDALIAAGGVAERLQTELLLELLTFAPEEFGISGPPTSIEIAELERLRRHADDLPDILRISRSDVHRRVVPFIEALQKIVRDIPQSKTVDEIFSDKTPKGMQSIIKWSANKSQIKRIRAISDVVSKYNREKEESLSVTSKYLELVNQFLSDSGKRLAFDERGYLHVRVNGMPDSKDITCLSSGEAQIFVILTHLAFNPLAQEANIFIIDEPELSLHVRWQELFVESAISANPNIQYIMATHSPSIILDKTSFCLELGKLPKGKARKGGVTSK